MGILCPSWIKKVLVGCKQGPDMGKCRPGMSRKVPPQVKAKSSLAGRNYFITVHH